MRELGFFTGVWVVSLIVSSALSDSAFEASLGANVPLLRSKLQASRSYESGTQKEHARTAAVARARVRSRCKSRSETHVECLNGVAFLLRFARAIIGGRGRRGLRSSATCHRRRGSRFGCGETRARFVERLFLTLEVTAELVLGGSRCTRERHFALLLDAAQSVRELAACFVAATAAEKVVRFGERRGRLAAQHARLHER